MKKRYKFAVGVCGTRMLYTNIIKADSALEAAKMYLDSLDKTYSEEELLKWENRAREVEAIVRENPFTDILGNELSVGDFVAFVYKYDQYLLRIETGEISRFTKAKVFIKSDLEKEVGFVSNEDSVVSRIVKLNAVEKCDETDVLLDALGQKLEIGQKVVYLGAFRVGTYGTDFTDGGIVTEINKGYVHGDKMHGKKMAKSFVVVK